MEMKTVRIKDLGRIVTGSTPSKKDPDNYGDYALWIKPTDIDPTEKYTRHVEEMYSEKSARACSTRRIPAKSTCVPCIGTVGTKLTMTPCDCFVNQSINAVIPNEDYDNDYVYYLLLNFLPNFKSLNKGTASGREYIAKTAFENVELKVHADLATQRKIGEILSSYDDLIDNCKRQIALLEETAQRLYLSWKYSIGFTNAPKVSDCHIPTDCQVLHLIDVCDIQYGYAFDGNLFNSDRLGHKILRIRNIPEGFSNDFTPQFADSKYLVHSGDIVIGMDGIFHINFWGDTEAYLVQRTLSIRPPRHLYGFIFEAIKEPITFFEKTLTGATVAHLGKKHIDEIEIVMPQNQCLLAMLNNYYNLRVSLKRTIRETIETREILLPRLISGEIQI